MGIEKKMGDGYGDGFGNMGECSNMGIGYGH